MSKLGSCDSTNFPKNPTTEISEFGADVIIPPDFDKFLEATLRCHEKIEAAKNDKPLLKFVEFLEKEGIGKLRDLIDTGRERRAACVKVLQKYIDAYTGYISAVRSCLEEAKKAREMMEKKEELKVEANQAESTGLDVVIPPSLPISDGERTAYNYKHWRSIQTENQKDKLYYPELELNGPGPIRITSGPEELIGHGPKDSKYGYINAAGEMIVLEAKLGQKYGHFNLGIDYVVQDPKKIVKSWYGGKVVYTGKDEVYGNRVVVSTNNAYRYNGKVYRIYQAYGHLENSSVKVGANVNQGEALGKMGRSGQTKADHVDLRTFIIRDGTFEGTLAQPMQPGWTEINLNALEKQLQTDPAKLV